MQFKSLQIRECRRCGSIWNTERIILEINDKIDLIKIKIAYCPACADSFASEVDRPTYHRTGKKIQ